MSDLGALHSRGTLGVARMAALAGLMAVVMPEEIAEVTNLTEENRTSHGWQPPLAPLLSMFTRNYNLHSAINIGSR